MQHRADDVSAQSPPAQGGNSLLDDIGAAPTLLRPGETAGADVIQPGQPSLLRPGEFPGEGESQNQPAYSPLAEQADIAGGRARDLAAKQQALMHPAFKKALLQALIQFAAPVAIGAIAGRGKGQIGAGAGAGVGGEASLAVQAQQEQQKQLEANRLQTEMDQAFQQQGSLATQAGLQTERQQRDQSLENL